MAVEGFKAQSEMVIDSLDRLITAWEERKESVVVEGVHLSLNFVSVAAIHATVFSCLRRREAGEQLYDPTTNTVTLIDDEYRHQCAVNSLSSKGMYQLIQRKGSSRHLMALMNIDGSVAKAWPVESDGNGKPISGHGSDKGIGSPMYGPLLIGKAEPVNLQFGNFGISAFPNDTGGTSHAGRIDESRGDGTESGSRYYSSCCSSPRMSMSDGAAKEVKGTVEQPLLDGFASFHRASVSSLVHRKPLTNFGGAVNVKENRLIITSLESTVSRRGKLFIKGSLPLRKREESHGDKIYLKCEVFEVLVKNILRLFAVKDDIFCRFQGHIENFTVLKQQYRLNKTANEVIIVIEAYRTLRDLIVKFFNLQLFLFSKFTAFFYCQVVRDLIVIKVF